VSVSRINFDPNISRLNFVPNPIERVESGTKIDPATGVIWAHGNEGNFKNPEISWGL